MTNEYDLKQFLATMSYDEKIALARALDYASMNIANVYNMKRNWENPRYKVAQQTYYKTKKEVFEYDQKRLSVTDALQEPIVCEFVRDLENDAMIRSEFSLATQMYDLDKKVDDPLNMLHVYLEIIRGMTR